jgi:UDP-N-acetylmuramate--alanine ligase
MPRKLTPDLPLFGVVVALVCVGVVMVYSASAIVAADRFHDPFFFLKKQLFWAVLGLGCLWGGMLLDYRNLERLVMPLLVVSFVLLVLVLVPPFGQSINGTRRWFHVGPVSFQPVELAKFALVLYLASYLTRKQEAVARFTEGLLPLLLVAGGLASLTLLQPDLGNSLALVILTLALAYLAGARVQHMALIAGAALPVVVALIALKPYRWRRMVAFMNPWDDPQGSGFQIIQSFLALGSGGWLGVGLGDSKQKLFYLPEPYTDFIFAIVGEELGLLGAVVIVALFALLIWRGLRIGLRAPDAFGAFLGLGLTIMLATQTIVNLGVVTGALPTKGLPLPFISFGGSALLMTMFSAGVLLNISQHGRARLGAKVYLGHAAGHVEGAHVVVYSSAVARENAEVAAARQRGIPVIGRAEMLAELMRLKYGIAIGGTHGKTTTTSMVAAVLDAGGLDPTVVVGGRVHGLGANARLGQGEFLVAEADESDGSFLKLSPTIAVVTTVDAEHLDHYADLDAIVAAFLAFVNKVPFYGCAVVCLDDANLQRMIPGMEKRVVTYGLNAGADVTARRLQFAEMRSTFEVVHRGTALGTMSLQVPGRHNVLNALAATAVALDLEIPFPRIESALAGFAGVQRRFQIRGVARDVLVVDDYGHHPAEIRATLAAAKAGFDRRVITVFQPHRYSRTQHLRDDFLTAFYQSDVLIVMDIYPAGEAPIPGVHARDLADGIAAHGHREVLYLGSDRAAIVDYLCESTRAGDLVLTLGAGDVGQLGGELLQRLGDEPGTTSKRR